ncbi:hypothetical protein [Streptomyces atratus]|uniref:hypothetical protein n=1 Tax=Streptomyces atratus TaxID=1893 RepID=UPI0033DB18D1
MSEMESVVLLSYAEGWDLAARALWRPLTPEAATARDSAGLPYTVAYWITGRNEPVEVRLVSWQDHYTGVWVYDEQGRRTHRLELRLLDDGRLFHRQVENWLYATPDMPEFDRTCARTKLRMHPGRRGRTSWEPQGDAGSRFDTLADVTEEQQRLAVPGFADWPLFSAEQQGLAGPLVFRNAEAPEGRAVGRPEDAWRTPRPAGPGHLDALFRPGTRMSTRDFPAMTVLEPSRCGTLRVPGGLLAVDCPGNDEGPRITVAVPPGEYVLEEAQVTVGYDCEWTGGWVTRTDMLQATTPGEPRGAEPTARGAAAW